MARQKLPHHLLEIVAAVAVYNEQFGDALMGEGLDQVAQDRELGRGIEIEVQLDVELAGVDPKGHGRQNDDLSGLLPSDAGRGRRDFVALHHVG